MYEFLTFLTWGLVACAVAPRRDGWLAGVTLVCGLIFDNWALSAFSVFLYLARHEL